MLSVRRPLPYMGVRWALVLQQEVENGVGDQPEDQIIERKRQPASAVAVPLRG